MSASTATSGASAPLPVSAKSGGGRHRRSTSARGRLTLRTIVLLYLGAILVAPVVMIAYRTFEHGLTPVFDTLTSQPFQEALKLTLVMVAVAVPLNTVFG